MAVTKVYEYAACSTCKKALKFLKTNKIPHVAIPIAEQPPTKVELRKMLEFLKAEGGSLKKLFNTSGVLYKEMNLSQKLPGLSEEEALDLLARNGKLIKRPFVLGDGFGLLGFQENQWIQRLL